MSTPERDPAVLDTHNDLPWQLADRWGGDLDAVDLAAGAAELHTD